MTSTMRSRISRATSSSCSGASLRISDGSLMRSSKGTTTSLYKHFESAVAAENELADRMKWRRVQPCRRYARDCGFNRLAGLTHRLLPAQQCRERGLGLRDILPC